MTRNSGSAAKKASSNNPAITGEVKMKETKQVKTGDLVAAPSADNKITILKDQ